MSLYIFGSQEPYFFRTELHIYHGYQYFLVTNCHVWPQSGLRYYLLVHFFFSPSFLFLYSFFRSKFLLFLTCAPKRVVPCIALTVSLPPNASYLFLCLYVSLVLSFPLFCAIVWFIFCFSLSPVDPLVRVSIWLYFHALVVARHYFRVFDFVFWSPFWYSVEPLFINFFISGFMNRARLAVY